jgi:hypothetical protein
MRRHGLAGTTGVTGVICTNCGSDRYMVVSETVCNIPKVEQAQAAVYDIAQAIKAAVEGDEG